MALHTAATRYARRMRRSAVVWAVVSAVIAVLMVALWLMTAHVATLEAQVHSPTTVVNNDNSQCGAPAAGELTPADDGSGRH